MLHIWVLVFFAHNIVLGQGKEPADEQITLGVYKNWMQCEDIRQQTKHYKEDVECIGMDFDKRATKQSFKMKWWA